MPRRQRSSLRFVGTGTANVRIDLRPDTQLPTLFGRRPVESVFIGLDDPAAFRRQLRLVGPASATIIGTPTPKGAIAIIARRV